MTTTIAAPANSTANPAPLGLCAFGMTTVLLNFHNAGFIEINSMILAMGIFYGGLAQVEFLGSPMADGAKRAYGLPDWLPGEALRDDEVRGDTSLRGG